MTDSTKQPHELRRLLTAMFDGALTDDDARQLEQVLSADATSRAFYRRYLELHAMLQYEDQPLAAATGEMVANETNLPRSAEEFLEHVRRASRQEAWQDGCVAEMASRGNLPIVPEIDAAYPGRTAAPPPLASEPAGANPLQAFSSSAFWFRPLVVFGAMILSALIGGAFVWQLGARREVAAPMDDFAPHLDAAAATSSAYAATLVNITNCRWDSAKNAFNLRDGSEVRPGQSLNLLEGIAEITSTRLHGGTGRFVLEGPLAMVMTGDGMPVLQYGKLFAAIDPQDDLFVLGTPLGQVTITGSSSIGVVTTGEDVTVHVFAGEASFELLWPMDMLEDDRFRISTGTSLRLATNGDGTLAVHRGESNQRCFVVSVPMSENRLTITDEYVAAIRQARPLAYWRFESVSDGVVRNEIDDRLHCRIHGTVGWRDYPGNRSAEFGVGKNSGYLFSDDNFDEAISKEYSLEAWVKPSHVHSGCLVSLAGWSERGPALPRHLAMLELIGPAGPWARLKPESIRRSPAHPAFHPERIRLLHRSPPGLDVNTGTSAYSKDVYAARQWQHIVGVKQGADLRLYVNGKVVAEAQDRHESAAEVRVLMGQLNPSGTEGTPIKRQYVGELDEVAVYGRALSEREIVKHYELGTGESASSGDDH